MPEGVQVRLLPLRVMHRIRYTFSPGRQYIVMGRQVNLEESASERVETMKKFTKEWSVKPVFGHGTMGLGFIDSQYVRILGETGMVGVFTFMWLIFTIGRLALWGYSHSRDMLFKGLYAGYIAGFTGLLVHGLSANTFITVRIMEPFWFMTAVIVAIMAIEHREFEANAEQRASV